MPIEGTATSGSADSRPLWVRVLGEMEEGVEGDPHRDQAVACAGAPSGGAGTQTTDDTQCFIAPAASAGATSNNKGPISHTCQNDVGAVDPAIASPHSLTNSLTHMPVHLYLNFHRHLHLPVKKHRLRIQRLYK